RSGGLASGHGGLPLVVMVGSRPKDGSRSPWTLPWQGLLMLHRDRAGARFSARQGTRRKVWSFQMSDEKRCIAEKQARPMGLREKSRHAVLWDLAWEQALRASHA